jgi:succinate-semialdehyde dehydrogenase / glutarate-semialdehyde dehydrogenase
MSIQLKHAALLKNNLTLLSGQWVGADSGKTITVTNPATGAVVAEVPLMGRDETERAIIAAETAQKSWKTLTAAARAAILRRWFDLIILHREDLANLLTAEQGKPLSEARGEVNYGASFIEWFAEEAKRVYGETIPAPMGDRRLLVLKQPIGVTAAITPWNFPIAMITRKAAPALAA